MPDCLGTTHLEMAWKQSPRIFIVFAAIYGGIKCDACEKRWKGKCKWGGSRRDVKWQEAQTLFVLRHSGIKIIGAVAADTKMAKAAGLHRVQCAGKAKTSRDNRMLWRYMCVCVLWAMAAILCACIQKKYIIQLNEFVLAIPQNEFFDAIFF